MTTPSPADRSESSRRSFFGRSFTSASAALLAAGFVPRTAGSAQEPGAGDAVPRAGRHIVIASQTGAKLDSHVETGGGTDDTAILQSVLDKAVEWGSLHLIMDGAALTAGLRVHSNTTIQCLNPACGFFHKANTNKPVLCNARPRVYGERLDKNITLLGGTYNNNCREQVHHYDLDETQRETAPSCFGETRWNITLEFFGVENFTMRDVTIRDQRTFSMLMGNFYRATLENIYIDCPNSTDAENQDGLHFNGNVRNGKVSNIYALSKGQTNDDLIALNADDSMARVENLGMECGDIENITFENIYAEDCHTLVRMLSVDSAIRNIRFKNLEAGCRCYAVNCDAARYCRTPLFREDDRPGGVGNIENVIFEDMTVHMTADRGDSPMIILECSAENLRFNGFARPREKDVSPKSPAFTARNVVGMKVRADGGEYTARGKGDVISLDGFGELCVCREGK